MVAGEARWSVVIDESSQSRQVQTHGVAFESYRNGSQAVDRGVEAPARFYVELPAVAGALQNRIIERAFGQGPEGMRTFVVIGEDGFAGADHDERDAFVLDADGRVLRQIRQRELFDLRTNCGVFQGRVHKGNGRAAR